MKQWIVWWEPLNRDASGVGILSRISVLLINRCILYYWIRFRFQTSSRLTEYPVLSGFHCKCTLKTRILIVNN